MRKSSSNRKASDNCKSYSSYSESSSHGHADWEFDFPSPSAECIHVTNLSDSCFKPQVYKGPHQLEWQDNDAENYGKIAIDQKSNSAIVSGIDIVGKIACAVQAQAKSTGNATDENGLPAKQDLIMPKVLGDSKTAANEYSPVCSNRVSGIEGPTEERLTLENTVLAWSTISALHECSSKETMGNEAKGELLESSVIDDDNIPGLKPKSILRGDSQPFGADLSTCISSSTSQMEACLFNVEDAKFIENILNPAQNGFTFRLGDNVIDKLDGPTALPSGACGGSTANDYSDLQKEHKSDGWQLPCPSEKLSVSQNGSNSEWRHAWDHSHEKRKSHSRLEVLEVSDPRRCCKGNNSSYAEESLNSKDAMSCKHQKSIQDADLYPPTQRSLEGSFRTQEGSSFHAQDCQADLYTAEQTMKYVENSNAFPASSHSHSSYTSFNGSKSSRNTACSYKASACPFMLPVTIHVCPYSRNVHHPACLACMPHFHGQDFVLQSLPGPSCMYCLSTMGHYQGHPDLGHSYCGFQAEGPCIFCESLKCDSPQISYMHDTSLPAAKAFRSSVNEPKKYPPLPQERMAPYVVCRQCYNILEVPVCFPSSGTVQKLRCGGCGLVSKFSVSKSIRKCYAAGLQPSAEGPTSRRSPPSFEFMAKHREQSVADLRGTTEISQVETFLVPNKLGSVSSCHLTGGQHNLQDNGTYDVKSSEDVHDAKLHIVRSNHSSQDEFFFKTLSRKSEFGSSRSLFSGFKTSSRFGVNNVVGIDDTSLHCVVDEKLEGLAFGAPIPSDGDSLDQRSPERFDSVDEPIHTGSFREKVASASEIQPDFQSERIATDKMRARLTLYALLNNESTKFRITMENVDSFQKSASWLWSPAIKSAGYKPMNQKPMSRKKKLAPIHLRTEHYIRNGPRHIAAMITKSWKHQVTN